MKFLGYRWITDFLKTSLMFGVSVALGIGAMNALISPFIAWILTGSWQWPAINGLLRSSMLGVIVGFVMSAFLINYAWLKQAEASMFRKILTTSVVVAVCFFIAALTSEYVGLLLSD